MLNFLSTDSAGNWDALLGYAYINCWCDTVLEKKKNKIIKSVSRGIPSRQEIALIIHHLSGGSEFDDL